MPYFIICCFLLLTGFTLFSSTTLAQENQDSPPVILNSINVTATRTEQQPEQIPNAVTYLKQDTSQNYKPGVTLDEFAQGTPGVFFQNQHNFAQDLRISIRGFGARSPFGVRGVQVRVDGIPQTLPDGQTQLDSIDPSLIERMEILRGPSASLFGNASGGMIDITTRSAPNEKFTVTPRQVFGQFGLFKSELFAGGQNGRFGYGLFGSHLQQKGWRDHSRVENVFSQLKLNYQTNNGSDWMLLLRKFYSLESKDPGGLTAAQVRDNPRQAASRNQQFNAGEEVSQEQFGLRYRKKFTTTQTLSITTHGLHRDFQNRLPFVGGGQVRFDRLAGGLALKLINDKPLFERPNRLLLGVDYGIMNDNRQRFNNDSGLQGARTLDQIERVQSVGPFFRNEWNMLDKLDLVVGGRWDWLNYNVTDRFQADGDQSGSKNLSQASGTAGLVYHLAKQHQVYTNIGSVFEAPTTTELINNPSGSGGFNTDLEAQTSLSHELGLRGTPGGFQYETAVFYIRSSNEITPFEIDSSPGRAFFRNAGKSRRFGVETRLASPVWHGWQSDIAYTYSDFAFEKFIVDNVNLEGNAFPGAPKHRWQGRVRYTHASGLFGQFRVQRVGKFFVNDINTVSNNAYNLGQLLFGWEAKHNWLEGSVFMGINNLFDEQYNANTRINAAFGRFFEPGPPLNVFGGLRVRIVGF